MKKENFSVLPAAVVCGLIILGASIRLLYEIWFVIKLEMPVTGRVVLSAGVVSFLALLLWLFITAWKKKGL